jgi:hypothetical protein
VARHDASLYQYLIHRFTGVQGVQIILDRRQAERRREQRPPAIDRRQGGERRQGRDERRHVGYTLVTLESPSGDPSDATQ